MDLTSVHMPYVMGAYSMVILIFSILTYWVLKEDRRARRKLSKLKSDAT